MKNNKVSCGTTRGLSPLFRPLVTSAVSTIVSGFLITFGSYALAATIEQGSFFRDNSVVVYGSQNKATTKDEAMIAYNLKKQMKSYINMSADDSLNEGALRNNNLVLLGAGNSNNILKFGNYLKTNIPLQISDDHFDFGNKSYSGKKDGIAIIYPSPYNPRNYVLIYYSNSVAGLENLVKNARIVYENDYQLINEEGKVVREGKFNKADFSWSYDPKLDKDYTKLKSSAIEIKTLNSNNSDQPDKIPNLLFLVKREKSITDSDIIVRSFIEYPINKYSG